MLYHALELTNIDSPINTEIFKSIATIFADKNKHKQVYICSKILATHAAEDETINTSALDRYAKTSYLKSNFLNKIASKTLEAILEGKFKKP